MIMHEKQVYLDVGIPDRVSCLNG